MVGALTLSEIIDAWFSLVSELLMQHKYILSYRLSQNWLEWKKSGNMSKGSLQAIQMIDDPKILLST